MSPDELPQDEPQDAPQDAPQDDVLEEAAYVGAGPAYLVEEPLFCRGSRVDVDLLDTEGELLWQGEARALESEESLVIRLQEELLEGGQGTEAVLEALQSALQARYEQDRRDLNTEDPARDSAAVFRLQERYGDIGRRLIDSPSDLYTEQLQLDGGQTGELLQHGLQVRRWLDQRDLTSSDPQELEDLVGRLQARYATVQDRLSESTPLGEFYRECLRGDEKELSSFLELALQHRNHALEVDLATGDLHRILRASQRVIDRLARLHEEVERASKRSGFSKHFKQDEHLSAKVLKRVKKAHAKAQKKKRGKQREPQLSARGVRLLLEYQPPPRKKAAALPPPRQRLRLPGPSAPGQGPLG